MRRLKTLRRPPIYPNGAQAISLVASSPRPSVSFGGFGLNYAARKDGDTSHRFPANLWANSHPPNNVLQDSGHLSDAQLTAVEAHQDPVYPATSGPQLSSRISFNTSLCTVPRLFYHMQFGARTPKNRLILVGGSP